MRFDRYALFVFLALIMISIAGPAFGTKPNEEEAARSPCLEFPLTINPSGLGSIQLGSSKEEVWIMIENDRRYEKVSKPLWGKSCAALPRLWSGDRNP